MHKCAERKGISKHCSQNALSFDIAEIFVIWVPTCGLHLTYHLLHFMNGRQAVLPLSLCKLAQVRVIFYKDKVISQVPSLQLALDRQNAKFIPITF